jgi:hypothetical protein
MARLTRSRRADLPKSDFGLPSRAKTKAGKAKAGSFPMPDKKHARLAIGMATRSEKAGNITPAQARAVKAKARSKLRG